MNYTIYYGTLPNGRRKIGVDEHYPNRIKKQKLTDHFVMEVHTCIYEVSEREIELQELHDVKVDRIPYWKVSAKNKKEISSRTIEKMRASKIGKIISEETKAKISNTLKGRVFSEESKAKLSVAAKGVAKPKVQCPHCDRTISTSNIKRHINAYHEEL